MSYCPDSFVAQKQNITRLGLFVESVNSSLLPGLRIRGTTILHFPGFYVIFKEAIWHYIFSEKDLFHSVSQFPLSEFEISFIWSLLRIDTLNIIPLPRIWGEPDSLPCQVQTLLKLYTPLSYIVLSSSIVQSRLYVVICVVRWYRSVDENKANVLKITTLE